MKTNIVLREQTPEQRLGIEFGEFLILYGARHDGQALETLRPAIATGKGLE